MATSTVNFALLLCCLLLLSPAVSSSSSHEDLLLDSSLIFGVGNGLACELAKCLRGQCVNSTSFPFYRCECNAGWMSPFGASWLPCILPNCSIDLSCANSSHAAPAPPPIVPPTLGGAFDICSLPVCGNGECTPNDSSNNSTDSYECKCDSGYANLRNKTDGYCIRSCAVGADCTNVNLPLGGSRTPPPAAPPPPPVSNQGGVKHSRNELRIVVMLAMLCLWGLEHLRL